MNFDLGGDLAAPGSQGAVSDLQVFDVNEVPLFSFQPLSERITQGFDFVHVPVLVPTSNLSQGENQQDHSTLQHNISFGTQTVPLDRKSVNGVDGNDPWTMVHGQLTAEQLSLLSRATITIEDLAEGYLALTTGTTITLDRDAAGYGWFIDSTPLTNEEFAAGSTPWQFTALEGSAAAGKIDLMTVLMHELGHVMNLGHVSSAVDGTRLMAGSIDPGIRRLPSVLDLGPVQAAQYSAPSPQGSAPQIWAPYLTHYTVSATGEQVPAPVLNPATLVQAAHTPSYSGIFNSGFGITDPATRQFVWTPMEAQGSGSYQMTFSVTDGVMTTSELVTLTVSEVNVAPVLTPIGNKTVNEYKSILMPGPKAFLLA